MGEAENRTDRPDGLSRRQARRVTISCLAVLVPVVLAYLGVVWALAVQPEIHRARLDRVEIGVRAAEVRHIMGLPRTERTETAPGRHGEVIWEYGWATVTFGKDGRVLSKQGHFEFD
jgi:hypothetical protein